MTDSMDDLRQASAEVSGVKVLSTAAQAVMIAATNGNTNVVNDPVYRQCVAAALRAAVLQAVPRVSTAADRAPFAPILAIAAELEG